MPDKNPTVALKARLEAELERIRLASAGALRSASVTTEGEGAEESEAQRVPLGYDNEVFSFDHCAGPVEFCEASAKTGDVEQVVSFIAKHWS